MLDTDVLGRINAPWVSFQRLNGDFAILHISPDRPKLMVNPWPTRVAQMCLDKFVKKFSQTEINSCASASLLVVSQLELFMKGAENEQKKLSHHMDRLGWARSRSEQ